MEDIRAFGLTIRAYADRIDLYELLQNPYVIFACVILAVFFLVRGMSRTLALFLATLALIVLVHNTVPASGGIDRLAMPELLSFAGGSVAVIALVVYFCFIRE